MPPATRPDIPARSLFCPPERIRFETIRGSLLRMTMLVGLASPVLADPPRIEIWHGEAQRVGHLGDAQDDFNVVGCVSDPDELDRLSCQINGLRVPLSFHAHRRLVGDGDFNADVPIGRLKMGPNTVLIRATNRQGQTSEKAVQVIKEQGSSPLPYEIHWSRVKKAQDVGQIVDGKWVVEEGGLRTRQTGYDRVFLIGDRTWKDYEVLTSITLHHISQTTSPVSGGNGVGIILRFAGHVTGGPRHFPSGQPKFGYQPFGAIAFLRWDKGQTETPPFKQFFPGDSDTVTNYGRYAVELKTRYALRFACRTLPDTPNGEGVTRYSFKIWPVAQEEPATWEWEHLQTSRDALRAGGAALLAHHVDVTFGDTTITRLQN